MMCLSVPGVSTKDIGNHAAVQHESPCALDWIKPLPKFEVICYSRRFPSLAAGGSWVFHVCWIRELVTFQRVIHASREATNRRLAAFDVSVMSRQRARRQEVVPRQDVSLF
jgi:hypothetical protein